MISVIIPVYNVEEYLPECLDSIIGQTFSDLEIILVDDGSTDSCPQICADYAARDSRIRVIRQENQGLSGARNTGIDACRGEAIVFVDSDDYMMTDAIETLAALQREYDADISIVGGCTLDESGTRGKIPGLKKTNGVEVFSGRDKMDAYIRQGKIQNAVWARLYRRELFETLRFPLGKTSEDVFVTHLLVHAANRIVVSDQQGYVYRIRSGSIMKRSMTKKDFDVIEGRRLQSAFIEENYPELAQHMPVKLCSAAVTLVLRSAADNFSDPEMDGLVQGVIRENLKPFLHSGQKKSRKLWAAMSAVSLGLARSCMRLYRKMKHMQ